MNKTEDVERYLTILPHPLKAEMEAVRNIIKQANRKISERIKWKAPSFFYKEDLVTFNPRTHQCIQLVFHHKAITTIQSDLLKGNQKTRRMVYFRSMEEIRNNRTALESILNEPVSLNELVSLMDE